MRWRLQSFVLACLSAGMMAAATPQPPGLRLGSEVSPRNYQLSLTLTPGKPGFTGDLTVSLEIKKPLDQIWLNAEELNVDAASLSIGAESLQPRIVLSGKTFVGFLIDREIKAGVATLRIHYSGVISEKAGPGISHSSRNHSDYVVTHFEPIAARRAFPCFDEPNFKVPWQLTINVPAEEMVISNTAVESDTRIGDRHQVVFHQTKPLPSYLVAFTIGAYEAIDLGKVGRNHTTVRLIVPKNDKFKSTFAAEMTPKIVERLENYFDIGYPYEKLDEVAVPNYPEASAMEDAGSILYDDSLILCAPENLTHLKSEQILSLLTHETTHQWFGDLVTMKWWDDAWLNEGFTEWLEWKIEGQFGEEWRDNLRAMTELDRVVKQDVLPSAHPVRQRIESASEIETAFDDITYFKTAEVLRMIEHYVGASRFQSAVRTYLRAHLFGNAGSADFLGVLSKTDPLMATAFSQFLNRKGLPQVDVALDCTRAEPVVHVQQHIFRAAGTPEIGGDAWTFPVCVKYSVDGVTRDQCSVLQTPTADIQLAGRQCPAWLLANGDAAGYYISHYDETAHQRLSGNLAVLSPLERLHSLWENSFLLSNGLEQPSQVTSLIQAFGIPSRVADLSAVLRATDPFLRYDTSPQRSALLVNYFSSTVGAVGRKLGWTAPAGASQNERRDQFDVVSTIAIRAEDPVLIQQGRKLAGEWLRDRTSIPPDSVRYVFRVAGTFADEHFHNELLQAAMAETNHENKMEMIFGLAAVRDPELLQQNLKLFISGKLSLQESVPLFTVPARLGTPASRRMVLEFVKGHEGEVRAFLPKPLGRDYSVFLTHLASPLCSDSDRVLAQTALRPILSPEDGGDQRLREAVDSIRSCEDAVQATDADFTRAFK